MNYEETQIVNRLYGLVKSASDIQPDSLDDNLVSGLLLAIQAIECPEKTSCPICGGILEDELIDSIYESQCISCGYRILDDMKMESEY